MAKATPIHQYFDKNSKEITEGCRVKYEDGTIKQVYLTEAGLLGTDATNPAWIKSGRAEPCEYGIYPFDCEDISGIEVVD